MGMDVHGINPQQNKSIEEFPAYNKIKKMRDDKEEGWKESWVLLDEDTDLRDAYYKEVDEYENINCGVYFRNNCWWWRPLWDYCRNVAPQLINEELYGEGHNNNGAGLDDKGAKELGEILLGEIANGNTIKYHAEYQQMQDSNDDEWASHYPFDIENVANFAKFCIQSGGFEIC